MRGNNEVAKVRQIWAEHPKGIQKLCLASPVIRRMGLQSDLYKPRAQRQELIAGKFDRAFDLVSGWAEGVWLVRLVHSKSSRVDHCVLVNARGEIF